MLRIVAIATALAVGATAVYAQNTSVIGQRKDLMKAIGKGAGDGGKMMKGEAPFNLATVQAALKVYEENSIKSKPLYPDDSKTGGETTVLPVIWEKKAEFDGIFDKLVADAKAAQVAIVDEATFKTEWPKVMANCGACHRVFREPPKK